MSTVGVLHPGAMGAAIGAELVGAGHRVVWGSAGRSAETRARAEAAGLEDVGSPAAVCAAADVVLSICPPHAAIGLAAALPGGAGLFADLNAIAPSTAASVGGRVRATGALWVDGGIVGPPPTSAGTTRLFLSGGHAGAVASLFADTRVEAVVLRGEATSASALKLAYAAWSKGSAALLLAARELARATGVEDALAAEWARSQPGAAARVDGAAAAAAEKGWRWTGEMDEIALAMREAGLPDGFYRAAAELFGRAAADQASGT